MSDDILARAAVALAAVPPETVHIAGSGVSLDLAGYRVRLEASHGDQERRAVVAALAAMPQLVADMAAELRRLGGGVVTVCTFCGEPIDGEPHYPHLDGCPRREAEYVDRTFVTCTCDTPPACPDCCGCDTGEVPGQLAIATAIGRALSGALDLTGLDHHQTVKAER